MSGPRPRRDCHAIEDAQRIRRRRIKTEFPGGAVRCWLVTATRTAFISGTAIAAALVAPRKLNRLRAIPAEAGGGFTTCFNLRFPTQSARAVGKQPALIRQAQSAASAVHLPSP